MEWRISDTKVTPDFVKDNVQKEKKRVRQSPYYIHILLNPNDPHRRRRQFKEVRLEFLPEAREAHAETGRLKFDRSIFALWSRDGGSIETSSIVVAPSSAWRLRWSAYMAVEGPAGAMTGAGILRGSGGSRGTTHGERESGRGEEKRKGHAEVRNLGTAISGRSPRATPYKASGVAHLPP